VALVDHIDLVAPALSPAQQEVLAVLGAARGERPQFDAELRHHLRGELEAGLAPLADELAGGSARDVPLFVSKHKLTSVHGCEARHLAEEAEPFAWSVATARGTVSHKAVELSVHWRGEATPLDLVDEAVARLANGTDSLADWLQSCSEVERAELRAEANDRVSKFVECWPPLQKQWRPVTEARLRVDLCDQRIVLSGKVDLQLGRSEGTTAGKVLVDLKTGGFVPAHLDDLRFYALLETLRLGTPPRRLATYYLDGGTFVPEDVTEPVLESTVLRVVRGIEAIVELRRGEREPARRAGPSCWWCPLRDGCDEGQAWVDRADDFS
jgi:hypothetical protein